MSRVKARPAVQEILPAPAGQFIEIRPAEQLVIAFMADQDVVAVITLDYIIADAAIQGLGLEEALAAKNAVARCGLQIVDLGTGDAIHWVRIEGVVRELYDVAFLPAIKRPSAIGFKTADIGRIISVEETSGELES